MQQDKPTINLTVPTGWDKLDDHQLRYVFGLLAQGFPSPQVKTYCLFRWTGMQVMHKYGKGWWCKFADKRNRCQDSSILDSRHLNWKRDPVGTFERYHKSRYDTLKYCDLATYE